MERHQVKKGTERSGSIFLSIKEEKVLWLFDVWSTGYDWRCTADRPWMKKYTFFLLIRKSLSRTEYNRWQTLDVNFDVLKHIDTREDEENEEEKSKGAMVNNLDESVRLADTPEL